MTSKDEIISGNVAPLRREIDELRAAHRRLQAAWINAAAENLRLERRRDELLVANDRLLARARRAERRERLFFVAPIVTGMMIGALLVVLVGGAL